MKKDNKVDEIDWKRRALEATVRADEAQRCLREAIEMGKMLDIIIPSTWVKAARE